MFKYLFLNKLIISTVLALVFFGGAAYFYFRDTGRISADTFVVERRDIVQEVSVSGTVKSANEVDLAFERGGRVSRVYVGAGSRVIANQVLVALDSSELSAQLGEARANIAAQKAKLDELLGGTRTEELEIAETKVTGALTVVDDAKINLTDVLKDSYTKSDDAVRNKTDQLFNNPRSVNPELKFQATDIALGNKLEQDRSFIEEILTNWNKNLNIEAAVVKENLNAVKIFLDDAAFIVNNLFPSANLSQATIDKYRSDISAARTNINTAISNLSAAEEKLRSAESALVIAQKELELKRAGASSEQINAQAAQLEQAEARVRVIEAQIENSILRSPFGGMVARSDVKAGEVILANKTLISVIGEGRFEIEAHIPEADIARVKLGDVARVTLDAYGNDEEFIATVTSIDSAETVIGGVPTYKTILELTEENGRIKSGMTANLDILTDRKEGAIVVPTRSVIFRNGDRILRVLVGGEITERKVVTGIRGSDGFIEIISGVELGEEIVVFIRD